MTTWRAEIKTANPNGKGPVLSDAYAFLKDATFELLDQSQIEPQAAFVHASVGEVKSVPQKMLAQVQFPDAEIKFESSSALASVDEMAVAWHSEEAVEWVIPCCCNVVCS